MSVNQYQKVTINQIDMDAVTEAVIAKGNLVYRTDRAGKTAEDVDKVSGTPSNKIAIAVDGDRTTIRNAQMLGGKEASSFMSKQDGGNLTDSSKDMSEKFADDILDIRDELYQLRGQLAKNGYVKDIGYYHGFYDGFRSFDPKHLHKLLASTENIPKDAKNILKLTPNTDMDGFDKFDYIAIVNKQTGLECIRQILSVDKPNKTITLDRNIANAVLAQNLEYYEVYKSYGTIHEGGFKIARPLEAVMGDELYASGVTDDTNRTHVKMMSSGKGFATTLKFTEGKMGYLKTVELCLKAYGNPGPVQCFLIDSRDIKQFKNGSQAEALYLNNSMATTPEANPMKFFAKTQPKAVKASVERQYVKFSFENNGKFPVVPDNYYGDPTRYCLIVEFNDVDTNNYYEMTLIHHEGTDLQINNTFYKYVQRSDNSVTPSLSEDDETKKIDMYYQFITQEKITNQPSPVKEGLYSAHIYNKNHQKGNRARVELRIKREGLYNAELLKSPALLNTDPLVLRRSALNGTINTVQELNLRTEISKPLELRRGDTSDISELVTTIVGENIAKTKGITDEAITFISPILAADNDPVYRMGYSVAIKARKFKLENGELVKTDFKRFPLRLKEVVKDLRQFDETTSDRLIFETDLFDEGQDIVDYNDYELQIFWENPEISRSTITSQEQMGQIREVTVSFSSVPKQIK